MTASQADDHGPYEVIHLGGEAAAIVPLADLRLPQAVPRHPPVQVPEQAEIEAMVTAHREWVAAGRTQASRQRYGHDLGLGLVPLTPATFRRFQPG
jgi:hypothetical protein